MKTTSRNHYDFIIYGATLEGALTGYFLHKKGFKTLILEPSDRMGQFLASVSQLNKTDEVPSLFANLSSQDESLKLITWLRNTFPFQGKEITAMQTSLPPVTFEKGSFEPFVGFGENAPKEAEFIQSFAAANRIELEPSVNGWINLIQDSDIEVHYNSTLTELFVEDGRVARMTINDKMNFSADQFLFCRNPAELVPFLDPSSSENKSTSQKLISRLSKPEHWSTLQLSIISKNSVSDRKEVHFLYGTQKNPIVCVGQVTGNTSQWVSFISPDVIDINEEGVQILKEMKRQIKRAYPQAFDDIVFEKIALWPKTHGYIDLKSKLFGEIEGISNLLACSSHLIEDPNPLVGSLKATRYTVNLLNERFTDAPALSAEARAEEPSA